MLTLFTRLHSPEQQIAALLEWRLVIPLLTPFPSCILIIATVTLDTLLFFSSPPSEPGFAIVLKSCKFSSFPFGMFCIFRYKQIIINKNINMINKLYYLCLNKEDTCVYFCHILSDHKFCFFKLLIHFNP